MTKNLHPRPCAHVFDNFWPVFSIHSKSFNCPVVLCLGPFHLDRLVKNIRENGDVLLTKVQRGMVGLQLLFEVANAATHFGQAFGPNMLRDRLEVPSVHFHGIE